VVAVSGLAERDTAPARARPEHARLPEAPVQHAGVVLADVPDLLRAHLELPQGQGILVDSVDRERLAAARELALLERYDVIVGIDGTRIATAEQFVKTLNGYARGRAFELRVLRKGVTRILRGEK
jgi:S1-C subfamily serine protease